MQRIIGFGLLRGVFPSAWRLISGLLIAALLPASGWSQDVVIADVRLFDGTGSDIQSNAWVAVTDQRISAVGSGQPPAASTVIQGGGRFLMPGLIDAHVHIGGGRLRPGESESGGMNQRRARAEQSLHGYLYSGVTTIYDSGNVPEFIFPLREEVRSGAILSPHVFVTGGVVTVPGGYGAGPGATLISGPDDFSQLDEHLALKPDMVKILLDPQGRRGIPDAPIFTPELLKQVIDRIHARGIRATAHIPSEPEARMAIEAGIDALAHLPARTDMSPDFAAFAAKRGVPMATTLAVFSNIARVAEAPEMFDAPLYRAVMPMDQRELQKTTERTRYIDSGMSSFFARMLPGMQQRLFVLHQAGVPLALGTDRSVGPSVHDELRLIVESGVRPVDALRMATQGAAAYLGLASETGTIEVGKLADLILLGSDPTIDITHSQTVEWVMLAGQDVDLAALNLPVNEVRGAGD